MAVVFSAFSGCVSSVVWAVDLSSRDIEIFCLQTIESIDQRRKPNSLCEPCVPEKTQCEPAVPEQEQLSGRLSSFLLSLSPLFCSSSTASVIHIVVSIMVWISSGWTGCRRCKRWFSNWQQFDIDDVFVVEIVWNRREEWRKEYFHFSFKSWQPCQSFRLVHKNSCLAREYVRAPHWRGLSVLLSALPRISQTTSTVFVWSFSRGAKSRANFR